jgi:uncharacterized alkaline shock family protein YloU
MKIVDRVFLVLLCILVLPVGIGAIALGIGVVDSSTLTGFLTGGYGMAYAIAMLVYGLLVLVFALKLLFSGNKEHTPPFCLVKTTELGVIRVSTSTLDALTLKAVRSFQEVKEVKSLVLTDMEQVRIRLRLLVMPGANIPELTQNIQVEVKKYVEEHAGIIVNEVMVLVDNLYNANATHI